MTAKGQRAVALAVLLAGVGLVVLQRARVKADFWPLDSSRVGPNLVASVVQWAIIVVVVALVYPPTRRAIERFVTGHVQSIKDHNEALHVETRAHAEEFHARMHRRLDRLGAGDEQGQPDGQGEPGGEAEQ